MPVIFHAYDSELEAKKKLVELMKKANHNQSIDSRAQTESGERIYGVLATHLTKIISLLGEIVQRNATGVSNRSHIISSFSSLLVECSALDRYLSTVRNLSSLTPLQFDDIKSKVGSIQAFNQELNTFVPNDPSFTRYMDIFNRIFLKLQAFTLTNSVADVVPAPAIPLPQQVPFEDDDELLSSTSSGSSSDGDEDMDEQSQVSLPFFNPLMEEAQTESDSSLSESDDDRPGMDIDYDGAHTFTRESIPSDLIREAYERRQMSKEDDDAPFEREAFLRIRREQAQGRQNRLLEQIAKERREGEENLPAMPFSFSMPVLGTQENDDEPMDIYRRGRSRTRAPFTRERRQYRRGLPDFPLQNVFNEAKSDSETIPSRKSRSRSRDKVKVERRGRSPAAGGHKRVDTDSEIEFIPREEYLKQKEKRAKESYRQFKSAGESQYAQEQEALRQSRRASLRPRVSKKQKEKQERIIEQVRPSRNYAKKSKRNPPTSESDA